MSAFVLYALGVWMTYLFSQSDGFDIDDQFVLWAVILAWPVIATIWALVAIVSFLSDMRRRWQE